MQQGSPSPLGPPLVQMYPAATGANSEVGNKERIQHSFAISLFSVSHKMFKVMVYIQRGAEKEYLRFVSRHSFRYLHVLLTEEKLEGD